MTISTTVSRMDYTGNGTTVTFSYAFKIFAAADLTVIQTDTATGVDTILTLTSDYAVSGVGVDTGGTITLTAGVLATGQTLAIIRGVDLVQSTEYTEGDSFPAQAHEDALDYLTMIAQQLDKKFERVPMLPEGSAAIPLTMPTNVTGAAQYLRWNAAGTALEGSAVLPTTDFALGWVDVIAEGGLSAAYLSHPGGGVFYVSGPTTVAANLTLPATVIVKVDPGAVITVNTGVTLTINGRFDAGLYQVFSCAGTGKVIFGAGAVKEVYPEWWAVNTVPGTTDMGAAIQAAITSNPRGVVAFGSTSYKSTVTISSAAGIWLKGSGIGNTIIYESSDVNLFSLVGSAWNDQFIVSGMTVCPATNMTTGAAFSFQADSIESSVSMEDVLIICGGGSEFKYGIKIHNCNGARFYNVTVYGINTTKLIGWNVTSTIAAHTPKWSNCTVLNALTGIQILNTNDPGIEGVQLFGCDLASVAYGLIYTNSVAGYTYFPPHISLIGGHIKATVRCIDVTKASEVIIKGTVLYLTPVTAAQEAIRLTSCGDVIIYGNYIWSTATGITLSSGTGVNGGTINDNSILGATGYNAINFTATNFLSMMIKNNQQNGADETVHVTGVLAAKVVVRENYPPDTTDGYNLVPVVANTIDVSGLRSDVVQVDTVVGATDITAITPRRSNDIITLVVSDSNLTFKHAGAGNIYMSTGADYVSVPMGSSITFARSGGKWIEISRSYWP
jgi:hypothetical protein